MGTTSFGLPTSGSGSATPGSFLGDTLKFETFHGGNIFKKLAHDPIRLITGVDPASTGLWNGILGTHNKPIVDQMGGATGDDYAKAGQAGINTTPGHGVQDLAHVIAAMYAIGGMTGGMGGGAGGSGSGAGADSALAGDNIDAGGGWNPASGGGGASSGSSMSPQQAQMAANMLKGIGQQQYRYQPQWANTQQQWQPGDGVQIVSPTY